MNTETQAIDGRVVAGRKLLQLFREHWGYPDWVTRILLESAVFDAQQAEKRLLAMGVPLCDLRPSMLEFTP